MTDKAANRSGEPPAGSRVVRSGRKAGSPGDGLHGELFLEKFVRENFLSQPPAIRSIVYLMFAILLAYAIYEGIGGQTSIHGRLFVWQCVPLKNTNIPATPTALQLTPETECEDGFKRTSLPARDFAVAVDDKHYGINMLGDYWIVLSRAEHLRLMAAGEKQLEFENRDGSFHEVHRLHLRRLDQSFEEITLPSSETMAPSIAALRAPNRGSGTSGIAWAAEPPTHPTGTVALFLTSVSLASGNGRPEQGMWSLQVGGREYQLQQVGNEVGNTPLVSGQPVDLGNRYFFVLPRSSENDGKLSGSLTLRAKTAYIWPFTSTYVETFALNKGSGFETGFRLQGSRGSEVLLYLGLPIPSSVKEEAHSAVAATCNNVNSSEECHRIYPSGCSSAGKYDAYLNLLKNKMPSLNAPARRVLGASDFLSLDMRSPLAVSGIHRDLAEELATLGEGTIVSAVGYVYDVGRGGTSESANCRLNGPEDVDLNVFVGFDADRARTARDPTLARKIRKSTIIAEITPHYRAQFHPGWSLSELRTLIGREVKIVGQLILDSEHHNPRDNCSYPGANLELCWRASAWEIHPVVQIYVHKGGGADWVAFE